MPPATVNGVDEGGRGKGIGSVVEGVDAMADGNREVLITTKVGGGCAADFAEGIVATGLRPGVGIEVGEEAVGGGAVNVNGSAEGGLAQNNFLVGSGPIL